MSRKGRRNGVCESANTLRARGLMSELGEFRVEECVGLADGHGDGKPVTSRGDHSGRESIGSEPLIDDLGRFCAGPMG